MAKSTYMLVQLVPETNPETGTKYIVKKSTKGSKTGTKIRLRKYDPVSRQHCWFVEKRMPSSKK
jgi:ribosomal protein L33